MLENHININSLQKNVIIAYKIPIYYINTQDINIKLEREEMVLVACLKGAYTVQSPLWKAFGCVATLGDK